MDKHELVNNDESIDNKNLIITRTDSSVGAGTLKNVGHIDNVKVNHDRINGKDEISVFINDEIVFRYDPNSKGRIVNHIQEVK